MSFLSSISALHASNSWTTSRWPQEAAKCKGV
jgi:hypothetical protein